MRYFYVLFYAAWLLVALLAYEGLHRWCFPATTIYETTGNYYETTHWVTDSLLGYAFAPDNRTLRDSKRRIGTDSLLYHVVYQLENGRRVTSDATSADRPSVVFIGDSFVFGLGLNDWQTLPWMLNNMVDSTDAVQNWGVPGYGLHQVYAQLASGRLTSVYPTEKSPPLLVYLYLPDHLYRAAGYADWDPNGPHYETHAGRPVFKGAFSSNRWLSATYHQRWRKSRLYQTVGRRIEHYLFWEKNLRRTEALFGGCRAAAEAAGWEFLVISIDPERKHIPYIEPMLKRQYIQYLDASNIIIGLDKQMHRYFLDYPHDFHPKARFNRQIALAIQRYLRNDEQRRFPLVVGFQKR